MVLAQFKVRMIKTKIFTTLPLSINNYFTKGEARSIKAKRNIVLSFVIKGLNILIGLLLVPLTIHYVDKTQYGVWLTLSSIIGWFGFFDIGFGNGLRNKFAEAVATGKYKLARIYVSTTYAILSIVISFVLIVFLIINPFLNWANILNTPQSMAPQLKILVLLVFTFFCVQFILQLLTTVLTANQQPAKAALFNFCANLGALLIIFILTKTTSGNLLYLGISLGTTPVLVLLISSFWFYKHQYKQYAPSLKHIRFKFAKNLMNLGAKFFVIQIAVVVLYQTSNIIISQLFSPTDVTSYNIAYRYFGIIPMLFSIMISPFWSAFTEAWVNKDINWIIMAMKKLKIFWIIMSIVSILMIVVSNVVYKFWVGSEIFITLSLTMSMASYVVINLWNSIYSQFLNGVGKLKLQLIIAVISSIINIPLSIYLCKRFGIHGVVLSTAIVSSIGFVIYPIQFKKVITNKAQGVWAS